MPFSQEAFAIFAVWTANIIFFSAMLPQLFLNYRLKSTRGLSDLFILSYFNSMFAYLGYTFSVDLPLVYKVTNPLYALSILGLVFQRFYYSKSDVYEGKILMAYAINIVIMLMLIFYALNSNIMAINFLGWLPVLIGSWKKIPQVLKVYRTKSVQGFSISFVLIKLFSCSFGMLATIILGLPLPVLINDLRGMAAYIIFLVQFGLYRKHSVRKVEKYVRQKQARSTNFTIGDHVVPGFERSGQASRTRVEKDC